MTAVLIVLLFLIYVMIFNFSAEDATASSGVSQKVTKWLLQIYYKLQGNTGGLTVVIPAGEVDEAEAVIRKLAHFTEYMLVGLLSLWIWLLWKAKRMRCGAFVLVQLVISASLDEFHQYFVPGRYASIRDVLIDTAGGLTGMLLVFLVSLCIRKSTKS